MEEKDLEVSNTKRASLDIIESMLKSIPASGIKKTHLANAAMLDYKVMEKYLSVLMNEDMVIKADGKIYITKKGVEFLKQYEQLKKIFSTKGGK